MSSEILYETTVIRNKVEIRKLSCNYEAAIIRNTIGLLYEVISTIHFHSET